MRKPSAILALISMLFAVPIVSADDHLVSRGSLNQRLNDAAAERTRKALPRLSDGDLSDLAQRAAALKADPVAGYHDAADALVFVMVFSAAALVLLAVANHH